MVRVVHPIEQESYAVLRSRVDLSALPPLVRAVTERVVHASADLDYVADLVADEDALEAGPAGAARRRAGRRRRADGRRRHHRPRRRLPGPRGARARRADPLGRRRADGVRRGRAGRGLGRRLRAHRAVRADRARRRARRSSSACRSASSARPSPRRRCARPGCRRCPTAARRGARPSPPPPSTPCSTRRSEVRPALLVVGHGTKSAAGLRAVRRARRAGGAGGAARRRRGRLPRARPAADPGRRRAARRRPATAASTSCRSCSSARATARATSPRRSSASGCATPAWPSGTAARSARTRCCSTDLEERLEAVVPREQWADTAVVLVGRGATDPDANAEVAKTARLLLEGRGIGTVETAFISLAQPSVPAGPGARPPARVRPRRRAAVLPVRRRAARPDHRAGGSSGRRSTRTSTLRLAGLIGPGERLARLVVERWGEIAGGDLRMNCDTCAYRVVHARLRGQARRAADAARPPRRPGAPARARHGHDHGHAH